MSKPTPSEGRCEHLLGLSHHYLCCPSKEILIYSFFFLSGLSMDKGSHQHPFPFLTAFAGWVEMVRSNFIARDVKAKHKGAKNKSPRPNFF